MDKIKQNPLAMKSGDVVIKTIVPGLNFLPTKRNGGKMILTEEQKKEFEKVVRPVMKFLGNPDIFPDPYYKIIIEIGDAELLHRQIYFPTNDYVMD